MACDRVSPVREVVEQLRSHPHKNPPNAPYEETDCRSFPGAIRRYESSSASFRPAGSPARGRSGTRRSRRSGSPRSGGNLAYEEGRCQNFDEDFQIGKVRIVRETWVPQLIGGGSARIGSELGKRARPERWPSFRFGRAARAWRSASRLPALLAHSPSPIARLRTQRNRTPPADNAQGARSAARLWASAPRQYQPTGAE